MPDNASERRLHSAAEDQTRVDEVVRDLETQRDNRRGSSVASSGTTTVTDSKDLTVEEMMASSNQLDAPEPRPEPRNQNEEKPELELEDQEILEELDRAYQSASNALETHSIDNLASNPFYDERFVTHMESVCGYLADQTFGSPEGELKDIIESLSTNPDEENGSRLLFLDMYAKERDLNDISDEIGDTEAYSFQTEFEDVGILEDDQLTDRGLYTVGMIVAQYEELEN